MNLRQQAVASLAMTALVWAVFSWPLPVLFDEAIPVGVGKRANSQPIIVHMMAGDHLQFLYYMWIFSDFLGGKTPFFYNLYEFNTGNDTERWRPGSYYFPYSLGFAALHLVGNRAFAWNGVSLLALWVACFFTWRLARRYTGSDGLAAVSALLPLLFPYTWIQLFGGSPAGFGMSFVPLLLYGLDIAVREGRMAGGWLAGFALLFAGTTDTHVFFFSVWITPCWCIVALTQRASFEWNNLRTWLRIAVALLPVALLAAAALAQTKLGTRHIQQSHAAGGRKIQEVALFSPRAEGLWAWHEIDVSYHIYFGYLAAAVLAIGCIAAIIHAARNRDPESVRRATFIVLIVLGIVGIVLLALGPFSPFEGRLFTAARKFIPGYAMIRQPAKIFVLLPSMIAVGIAAILQLGLERWACTIRWLAAALAAGFALEYYFQSKPVISLLDQQNAAYAEAARDAEDRMRKPRAVILPLWPGDSHYTSVYQYYASLYRIRMINGYRPFVPKEYIEGVFKPYQPLNIGYADDSLLDSLVDRGIDHVILHEDMYPEKASPFPVGTALRGLLNHPRLTLLAQDGPVWAFRILPSGERREEQGTSWAFHFPARRIEAERQKGTASARVEDVTASGGAFVQLSGDLSVRNTPIHFWYLPEMRWILRVRGNGLLMVDRWIGADSAGAVPLEVSSQDWTWVEARVPRFDGVQGLSAEIRLAEGGIDVDVILLVAGDWTVLEKGESLEVPAPVFFHAGHTDLENDAVVFLPNRDRKDLVFYGPKLPLIAGRYRIVIDAEVSAKRTGAAGTWIAACPEGREIARMEMNSGRPAEFRVEVPSNLPFLLAFVYRGEEKVEIRRIRFVRDE